MILTEPIKAATTSAIDSKVVAISIPPTLKAEYKNHLQGMRSVSLTVRTDQEHPYIDVGDSTLVLIVRGADLYNQIRNGQLPAALKGLAQRCEYPVLVIDGPIFSKSREDGAKNRACAGFVTHLELFTRIRTIQAPTTFYAIGILQLIAKQTQLGFHSFGLEDL